MARLHKKECEVIIENLIEEVREKGGTVGDVRYLATPEGREFLARVASRLVAHRRELALVSKLCVNASEQSSAGGVSTEPSFLF